MMKKISGLFLIVCTFQISAQDASFDQSNSSLLMLNPSFAGSNRGYRVQTSTRAYALGYSGAPLTIQASLDGYVKSLHGGVYASVLHDAWGTGAFVSNAYNLGYAYHLSLFSDKLKVIPSVQGSYLNQKIDNTWLPFGAALPTGSTSKNNFDLSSGILVQYRNLFSGGVSVYHINQPDIGILGSNKLNANYKVHWAYTFHFNERRLLQIMSVISGQGSFRYAQLNGTLVLNHVIAGLGISNSPAPMVFLGYRGNVFTAQVSYSVDYDRLAGGHPKSIEVHLSANIRDKEHRHVLTNIENW